MKKKILVRDLRVTDKVFTVWGEGPIALTDVKHGTASVRFTREDGWVDRFDHQTWDDATMDFTADATMVVWREDGE